MVTATSSSGSSSTVPHAWPASRSASAPAVWNAASEESTLCALPSTSVARTSTTGWCSSVSPRSSWLRMPFSTLGMNCVGTDPPTTWDTNSNPDPRGSGSNSTWQTAYWPCPPDCLTWRPVTRAGLRIVARSGTLTGSVSTSAPLARRRDSTTSACASPMHHSTVWCVSGLRSRRSVGSAATSRVSVRPSASSSARLRATTATGSSGSGRFQHDSSSGSDAARDGVAGLGAAELGQRGDVARDARLDLAELGAERGRRRARAARRRRGRRRRRSSSPSVVGRGTCPLTCTEVSGRSVPENTRTSDTRPT